MNGQRVLAGQGVGLVVAGRAAEVPARTRRLEDVEVVVGGEALAAGADEPRPQVPARRRDARRAQPVQPLAGEGGVIARGIEPGGEVALGVLERLVGAAAASGVALGPVVVGVLAGEEGRPRRAAERVGGERVLERHARRRRADRWTRRQRPHRLRALVVGHHDDEALPLAGQLGNGSLAATESDRHRCERQDQRRGETTTPAVQRRSAQATSRSFCASANDWSFFSD